MEIKVIPTGLKDIESLRILFLHENHFQFVHNKCHLYGWADCYACIVDGIQVGYGAVWGQSKREDRDAIFEFYIIQSYRKLADAFFKQLHTVSGAVFIECQSNEPLLSSMLYQYAQNINAESILFEDHFRTDLRIPGAIFQKKAAEAQGRADDRAYVLQYNDEVAATGGLMLNYNMPYADIYYEVKENYRQKGLGAFMVQELKKAAYEMGRVPAARCNIKNTISKYTLLKAGFTVCGSILKGVIQ
jgi:GNAT superfamily N-acetyltransferase